MRITTITVQATVTRSRQYQSVTITHGATIEIDETDDGQAIREKAEQKYSAMARADAERELLDMLADS